MPSSEVIDRLHEAMCAWKMGWTPEDLRSVREDLLAVVADLAHVLGERCCVCGKPEVGYHNYKGFPFCIPCANGGSAT